MSSQIDNYLKIAPTLKSTTEARKHQFVRLVSFKEFPKDCILPATVLSHLGFFYDPKVHAIRCSECNFNCKNLKISLVTHLVYYHYKFNDNCPNIQLQKEFLNDALSRQSAKIDVDPEQEKVHKQMTKKENRLNSFENTILSSLSHHKLVENGFYVDNTFILSTSLVKIRCAFCSYNCIIYKNYHLNNKYEDPFEEHRTISLNCPILVELNKSNPQSNQNTIMPKVNVNQINEILENIKSDQQGKSILYNNPDNFDVIKSVLSKTLNAISDKPFHPGYATEQSRLESFKDWPMTVTQRPDELAKAGFYYYGCKDQVKCFFCNGGLRNWDPTDEPIWEHARWFPKCSYIRQLMGAKFLEEVKDRYKDQDSGFTDDLDETPQYYELTTNDERAANNVNQFGRNENRPAVNQNQNANPQQRERAPSPRTINARLDLPAVRKIMDLGIKRNTIKLVVEKKLKEDGKDFDSNLDLAKACLKHEENAKRQQEQFKQTVHLYVSNISNDVTDNKIKQLFVKKFQIEATFRNFSGIILICLKEEDLDQLDNIVNELNEKVFPGSKLKIKIIVKKVGDQKDIKLKRQSNFMDFEIRKRQATGITVKTEATLEINMDPDDHILSFNANIDSLKPRSKDEENVGTSDDEYHLHLSNVPDDLSTVKVIRLIEQPYGVSVHAKVLSSEEYLLRIKVRDSYRLDETLNKIVFELNDTDFPATQFVGKKIILKKLKTIVRVHSVE